MISFANSSQFGNNTSIDPGAMLDDGLIDVCIVKRVPIRRLPIVSPLLFLHRFDRTDYVEIIKAKDVRVTRKRGKYIHFDGEPVRCGKTFEVKILPLSLNIIIP
jgi:diacylglycerol kinase family enzyme